MYENAKKYVEFIGIWNVNICVCQIHTQTVRHEVQLICHFYIDFKIMSGVP